MTPDTPKTSGSKKLAWPQVVAGLLILAYAVTFAHFGIERYRATFSHDWRDEALNNQMFYNTAKGDPLYSTVKGPQRHHRHFRPIFVPASLPYVIVHDARAWFAAVALLMALGGVAAFRLGKKLLGEDIHGLAACAAWLIWPATIEVTMGNLDPETFVAVFWLFAILFYVENRFAGWLAFAILALACKETQAPVLAAFGLVALADRKPWRWGVTALALGVAWFVVALKVVIPMYAPDFGTIYNRFVGAEGVDFPLSVWVALREHPKDTLAQIFSREHVMLLEHGVRSLGYLSLLSPVALLGTGTIALQILLQNEPLPVRQTHMLAALLPFTFWAALRGAAWLSANIAKLRVVGTRRQKDAALGLVGVMIAASVVFHIGPQSLFGKYQNYGHDRFERYGDATHVLAKSFRTPTPAERDAVQALDAIDQDAFVIANSRLLLLLSNRRRLGEFGNQIDLNGFDEAQYVALWFLEAECRTCTYARLSPESLDLAADLVTSGRFTATHATDAFALLTAVRESAMRPTPENQRYLARLADLKGRLERDEGLPPDIPDGV